MKNKIEISKVQLQNPHYRVMYKEYDQLIKARNLATRGQGAYQLCVKEFLHWLELNGINRLTRLTSQMMIEYGDYLSTRPNKRGIGIISESTFNQHLYSLRLLTDYLLETGQLKSAVIIPQNNPGTKSAREFVTQKEIMLIYKACKVRRERALLSILYGCGLRRTEAQDLNTNDINFHNGILIVREGKFKKRRDVPMNDAVIKDLREYLVEERSMYLKDYNHLELAFFINNKGKRMGGDQMNNMVKEIKTRTKNLKLIQKEITAHSLRHSIATHMAENGADIEFIRDFLGHTEIDTSYIYSRKNKQQQKLIRLMR